MHNNSVEFARGLETYGAGAFHSLELEVIPDLPKELLDITDVLAGQGQEEAAVYLLEDWQRRGHVVLEELKALARAQTCDFQSSEFKGQDSLFDQEVA